MIERCWEVQLPPGLAPYWRASGSLADLGLPDPPSDYDEEPSQAACAAWVTLYRERRAAYDAWYVDQLQIAAAAIERVRAAVTGFEARLVRASRGVAHVAAFGWDGSGHGIECIAPCVGLRGADDGYDHSGASVIVRIGEWFGGGEGWFGPPGHRVYTTYFPVEGRTPWITPPADAGLEALIAASEAQWLATYRRREAACARVRRTLDALRGCILDLRAAHRYMMEYREDERARRIEGQLDAQLADLPRASLGRSWRSECFTGLDVWPGRGARPRRHLPVIVPLESGWHATLGVAA